MGTKNQDFPKAGKALSFVPDGFNLDFKVFLWYFDVFSVIFDGIFLEQNRGLNGAKIAFQLSFGLPFSSLGFRLRLTLVLRARRRGDGVEPDLGRV